MPVETISWHNGTIHLIDQTALPTEYKILKITELNALAEAICSLRVRGAPAIGIAAALGVAMVGYQLQNLDKQSFLSDVENAISILAGTRPTAVNLFWALDRMTTCLNSNKILSVQEIYHQLEKEAVTILEEDKAICRAMGRNGATLLPNSATILTHCNAGGLATADYGTALAVVYAAQEAGKSIKVYADETRPLLQGSRLTAWELQQSGIDVTVQCDVAAGFLMQQGKVDAVIVGADRITANGDVANKIGTYSLAVLAKHHNIPFYVVAPVSTFDFSLSRGTDIPIEQRKPEEVTCGMGKQTAPDGIHVYNPAFDVTPNELVTAIVTEKGVIGPPYHLEIERKLRTP